MIPSEPTLEVSRISVFLKFNDPPLAISSRLVEDLKRPHAHPGAPSRLIERNDGIGLPRTASVRTPLLAIADIARGAP
jgi:hypothetical protein